MTTRIEIPAQLTPEVPYFDQRISRLCDRARACVLDLQEHRAAKDKPMGRRQVPCFGEFDHVSETFEGAALEILGDHT